jgi:hypothetical protein
MGVGLSNISDLDRIIADLGSIERGQRTGGKSDCLDFHVPYCSGTSAAGAAAGNDHHEYHVVFCYSTVLYDYIYRHIYIMFDYRCSI